MTKNPTDMNKAFDHVMQALLARAKHDADKPWADARSAKDSKPINDDIEEMYKYHEENFEQKPICHYEVIYNDADCEGGSFDCWADNVADAARQCERETPGATVVGVHEIIDAEFKDEVIQAPFEPTILPRDAAAIISEGDGFCLLQPRDGKPVMTNHELALAGCFLKLTEADPTFREEMKQVALDHVASLKEQEQGHFDLN